MRYKLFGNSGLRVSELCLGTMTFGKEWSGNSYDESLEVFNTFKEAGGNFLDTADFYTQGTSEEWIGEFIAGERDQWVVATKYSLSESGKLNSTGNHRKHMMRAVEESLKRLKTDFIDILWLHAWDYTTPIEEVMRAFDDLVTAGKVNYVGFSDTPAWIVSEAVTLANFRSYIKPIAIQIEYSLKERTSENDLLPMSKYFDLAVAAWSPLGGGVLTGKYNKNQTVANARYESRTKIPEKDLKIAEEVAAVATILGVPASRVAVAWLLKQYQNMFPIIGAKNKNQLQETLDADNLVIPSDLLEKLNTISQIDYVFPHNAFKSTLMQDFCFGGTLKRIENHRL